MKTLFLSAVVLFLAVGASAQETPNYNLSSAFLLAKCVPATDENGSSTVSCQNDPSTIVNRNQTIALTCGASRCTGGWTGTLTVEGTAYTGTINVQQDTSVDGVVTTDVSATVSNTEAIMTVNPSNNVVTDVTALVGKAITSTTEANTFYILGVGVAPANVSATAMKANFMHKLALKK